MWELIFPTVTVGFGLWTAWSGIQNNRWHLRAWQEAATACGLQVEEITSPWAMRLRLKARAGPVEVRIEDPQRKDVGVQITVVVPGPPGFSGVRIRREQNKRKGAREIEVGDEPFDDAFFIEGPMRLVCALLDMEARHLLISVNAECKVAIAGGEIQAEVFRSQVPDLLPLLFEIGQRFAQPLDVAQRLAENVQRDPDAGARLRNLLLLAREHPREPATVEVLRAACADPSPEVRLRAAKELGNERRDVLMELAENTEDDAVSAQALSLVGRELPMDRTKAILLLALRRRRLQTARACLETLGTMRDAVAVDILAKVLARENGELAAAAAEALGKSGNTAAEPVLIRALERDKSDIQVAAANALARLGTTAAVLPLKEAAERSPLDADLFRATRQAIAEIQSRLQGATPGQLSLAGADVGQLSLAPAEAGQLSLAEEAGGRLSLASEEPGQRS